MAIISLLQGKVPELHGLSLVALMNLSQVAANCATIAGAGAMQPLALLCGSPDVKVARLAQDCITILQKGGKSEAAGTDDSGPGVDVPYVEYGKGGPLQLQSRRIKEADIEKFCFAPAPTGHTVQCRVKRDKVTGFYDCFLDDNQTFKFLMTGQKKKSKSANYHISADKGNMTRGTGNQRFMGKLRGNMFGSEFFIYDEGANTKKKKKSKKDTGSDERGELGMVIFPKELIAKGARKMAVLLPALDEVSGKPRMGKMKLMDEFKRTGQSTENLVALVNKQPVWDASKNMYILDFRGRVTQASIRNFQAVRAENENDVVIQFGKVGDNSYTMDFASPVSAFQAFAVSLTAFEG